MANGKGLLNNIGIAIREIKVKRNNIDENFPILLSVLNLKQINKVKNIKTIPSDKLLTKYV